MNEDWERAVREAKEELGYTSNQYVEDFDEVVETAKAILSAEVSAEARDKHEKYLKSDDWKELRMKILKRDDFKCVDCKGKAIEVHHKSYENLGNNQEENDCISLCHECHKKRHFIKKNTPSVSKCKYCGEDIVWIVEKGKNLPTNPKSGANHLKTCKAKNEF